jgi:hypothetical protein
MPSLHRAGAREPVSRRPSRRRDLRLLLVVMVLGASAMATMAYVAYLLWPRWPESAIAANAPALPITVGGVTFNLPPAAYSRSNAAPSGGAGPSRLVLRMAFP